MGINNAGMRFPRCPERTTTRSSTQLQLLPWKHTKRFQSRLHEFCHRGNSWLSSRHSLLCSTNFAQLTNSLHIDHYCKILMTALVLNCIIFFLLKGWTMSVHACSIICIQYIIIYNYILITTYTFIGHLS